jgi:hypothetical protein
VASPAHQVEIPTIEAAPALQVEIPMAAVANSLQADLDTTIVADVRSLDPKAARILPDEVAVMWEVHRLWEILPRIEGAWLL